LPYTSNTATIQILDDSSSHVVAKLHLYQHSAGNESDVLKINVNALVGRTQTLTIDDGSRTAVFHQGETVTDVANATCIGYVSHWKYPKLSLVLANSASPVDNSATLLGTRGGSVLVKGDGAAMDPALLSLRSLTWSVIGNTTSRVALQWEGSPNTEIIAVGPGSGYIGRNTLGTTIPNDATSPTGSISVSPLSMPALSSYTLILECAKVKGFETRPIG
jgi:hypothetical protein